MEESSLPRELQLIIDDIVQQNVHLLEWEVFGNTTEDMRVVLTWRHIEFAKNSRWNLKQIGKGFGDEEDEDDAGSEDMEDYWQAAEAEKALPVEVEEELMGVAEQIADLQAANEKLEEVEQVLLEEEEIDLSAKKDIAPEHAKRMVQWQRKKFSVSVEGADLDDREISRRFPDGLSQSLYGEGWDKCCPTDGDHQEPDDDASIPGLNNGMDVEPITGKFIGRNGSHIDIDERIAIHIRPDGSKLEIDLSSKKFMGRDGSSYDATTGEYFGRDGSKVIFDPSIGMYMTHDGSSMVIDIDSGRFVVYDGRGMSIDATTGRYIGYDGRDLGTNRTNLYGMYAAYDMRGMYPGMFGTYGGSGFVYNPKSMAYGYEYEYDGAVFVSKRIKKKKLKPKQWGPGSPVIRIVEPCYNNKGWECCVDCRYNDFCDRAKHKDEYIHMLWEDEKKEGPVEECKCNVCTGGAVHNGCFYRELLRLKSEYLVFDKNNYCFCSECIPFKYRKNMLETGIAIDEARRRRSLLAVNDSRRRRRHH